MNKLTRKFNNAFARCAFWNAIKRQIDGFSELIQPIEALTSEDREVLKEIQFRLYSCRVSAQEQEEFYQERMQEVTKNN